MDEKKTLEDQILTEIEKANCQINTIELACNLQLGSTTQGAMVNDRLKEHFNALKENLANISKTIQKKGESQ